MGMRIAFYKGTDPGLGGLMDRAIRGYMRGSYSHSELVFSDGWTGVASTEFNGVALIQRDYDPAKWDLVDVDGDEPLARAWFYHNLNKPYDWLGDFGFVFRPIRGLDGAYFCSEAVAAALGWKEPWRYDPNLQYNVLTDNRAFA